MIVKEIMINNTSATHMTDPYLALASAPRRNLSLVFYEPIYNDEDDLRRTQTLAFEFQVNYNLAAEIDSNIEQEDPDDLETRTFEKTLEYDKGVLFSTDREQIQGIIYNMLDLIEAPRYDQVVGKLTDAIFDLKECDATSNVKGAYIAINVIVLSFPDEDDDDDDHYVDVKLAVAPASDEAVEQHLETTVVENESCCVICLDKIPVGSDTAAGRMPCSHVFHRACGEAWLRSSGICPVCRAVFPS